MPSAPSTSPLVIAHRGASGAAPENTGLAIVTAMDLGADMVEVDVQLSRDGQPVIFHDLNLSRTVWSSQHSRRALKSLRISDLSLKEIKQLDVGSWKDRKFAGLSIPTLAEVLLLCEGRISLNLEIKLPSSAEEGRHIGRELLRQLSTALTLYRTAEPVLISSFDPEILELARTIFPNGRLGVLRQPGGDLETLRIASRLKAFSVHLPCRETRAAVVKSAHAQGLRLFAYTTDSTWIFGRLIAAGVDGIFTNVPDRMLSVLGHTVRPNEY
jgi:glycerophosphoryl diester phosphodiesterase